MGRDLTFLAIGVAVGILAATLAQRVTCGEKNERPEAIQDKISNRLDSLEKQYSPG